MEHVLEPSYGTYGTPYLSPVTQHSLIHNLNPSVHIKTIIVWGSYLTNRMYSSSADLVFGIYSKRPPINEKPILLY